MQATPTSAARVLGIPELAGLCCEQLQNAHSLKSLGSLAVTSRTLEEIASKYLWARLPTLLPLMLTLPEVKVWNHPQHPSDESAVASRPSRPGISLSFNRSPAESSWSRFNHYCDRIVKLTGSSLGFYMDESSMADFIKCHRERNGEHKPLLPRLKALTIVLDGNPGALHSPVSSALLFLEALHLAELDYLRLDIRQPTRRRHLTGWPSTLQEIEDGLLRLFETCKPRRFLADIYNDDIPLGLANHLANDVLEEVQIFMHMRTPQGYPRLRALPLSLANLPRLHLLAISPAGYANIVPAADISGTHGQVFPLTFGFQSLQQVSLTSRDFSDYIPFAVRSNLSGLNLDAHEMPPKDAASSVVENLRGCDGLEDLTLDVKRHSTAEPVHFPWQCFQTMNHLTFLEILDNYAMFYMPDDNDLKLLSSSCPGLEVLRWREGAGNVDPEGSLEDIGMASLRGIGMLASCPLKKLDIPIHVIAPATHTARDPHQRFGPNRLDLRYDQWTYEDKYKAAELILDALEDMRPLRSSVKEWICFDHKQNRNLTPEGQHVWRAIRGTDRIAAGHR